MKVNEEKFQKVADEFEQLYKDEAWFLYIQLGFDSGGITVDIFVNGYIYPKEDPIPRIYNGIPICVMKKMIKLTGEKLV